MMRYLLILLLILTGCGSAYKTQYYMHEINTIPISTIDSINKVHNINIPLYFDNMQTIIQLIEKCCQENEKNNRTRTEILIEKGEISEEEL
jgi:uncharacterized lipoprotein YmbA